MLKDSFNRELSTMELRFRAGNYGALHDVAGERLVELRSSLSSPRRADRHEGQFWSLTDNDGLELQDIGPRCLTWTRISLFWYDLD